MKALTLWQPWATLCVIPAEGTTTGRRAKKYETRSWGPPASMIGQRVAIHAAATPAHLDVCGSEHFRQALAGADTPLGVIVGTAVIKAAGVMFLHNIQRLARESPREIAFGLWLPGRYYWQLGDVERLAEPVPARGMQKLWTLPDDVLEAVKAAPHVCPSCAGSGIHYEQHDYAMEELGCPDCEGTGRVRDVAGS